MCAGPRSLFPATRAWWDPYGSAAGPGSPALGRQGCGRHERSETVSGPRAPLLLTEGACAWPPLRALMCAVRAAPGTHTSLHGSVWFSLRAHC